MIQVANWKKVVGTILGTLLLGALGSGLWEIALKPLAQWSGTTILTIATLGSTAIKDDNFREAAKGLHESSALQLFALVTMAFIGLVSGLFGYFSGRRVSANKISESYQDLDEATAIANLKAELEALNQKRYSYQLGLAGCGFLAACLLLISYLKLLQANNAYTFYAQSMSICRPYMDDQEVHILESRFASITGRADYIAVTDELRQIAASNHRKLPDFKPW